MERGLEGDLSHNRTISHTLFSCLWKFVHLGFFLVFSPRRKNIIKEQYSMEGLFCLFLCVMLKCALGTLNLKPLSKRLRLA